MQVRRDSNAVKNHKRIHYNLHVAKTNKQTNILNVVLIEMLAVNVQACLKLVGINKRGSCGLEISMCYFGVLLCCCP